MQEEYTSPMAFKKSNDLFSGSLARYTKPTTKATWEGVDVADYFRKYFEIKDDKDACKSGKAYAYSAWLGRIKKEGIKEDHAKRLIEIMLGVEAWLLKDKGKKLHRGKWMFNRFRYEIKEKGVDKYIASKS